MKKEKSKKSKILTIALLVVLILLILAAVAGVAGAHYIDKKLDKIDYTPAESYEHPQYTEEERQILEEASEVEESVKIESSEAPPEGEVIEKDEVVNVLLLGTDMRIPYTRDPGRADAIQVISLNLSKGTVKLISFERGIMVPVPEHGTDLLTHAYRWAGPEYMLSLFRDYFLMDMAGYAQVDFDTFQEIIDDIGGIDVELSEMEAWALRKVAGGRLQEGVNHLDGYQALHYCRLRSIDSNWVRVERQRKAIQAAMDKVKSLSLTELDELADKVLPLIHTNLSKEQISRLLRAAPKILGAKAEQMTVPYRVPGQYAFCDFQAEAERLRVFIYGED